jgi:hypothetical protein
MSCRATAMRLWDLKHADASRKEFDTQMAAPNTDTNMHRATAAPQESADESAIQGGNQKVATSTLDNCLLMKEAQSTQRKALIVFV